MIQEVSENLANVDNFTKSLNLIYKKDTQFWLRKRMWKLSRTMMVTYICPVMEPNISIVQNIPPYYLPEQPFLQKIEGISVLEQCTLKTLLLSDFRELKPGYGEVR